MAPPFFIKYQPPFLKNGLYSRFQLHLRIEFIHDTLRAAMSAGQEGPAKQETLLIQAGGAGQVSIDAVRGRISELIVSILQDSKQATLQREKGRVGALSELQWVPDRERDDLGTVVWTCPLQRCAISTVAINEVSKRGCRAVSNHLNTFRHQVIPRQPHSS